MEHCGAAESTALLDAGMARLVAAAPTSSSNQPNQGLQPGKSPDFLAARPRLISSERMATVAAPAVAFWPPAFIRFLDLPIRSDPPEKMVKFRVCEPFAGSWPT